MKTQSQLAEMLYGDPKAEAKPAEKAKEPPKQRTTEELSRVVYPAVNPDYAEARGEEVADVLRDTDGRVIASSFYRGNRAALAASIGDRLRSADLSGLDFTKKGSSLAGSDLRAASLRGVKVDDLSMANITGAVFDSSTDISECNFMSCRMDEDTYQRLRGCRGYKSAKNLVRPRVKH